MFKNYKRKKAIKNFVKSINKKYKSYSSNTWSSLWTEGKIWYTFQECEGDKEYLDYIEKEYHFRPDNFMISLLHEIGHLETEDQELSDDRAIELSTLKYAFENDIITREEYFEKYFNIEAEMLATQWAVDYYVYHPLELSLLSQCL